jgi:hypothetical protein
MPSFFAATTPPRPVEHGAARFELPIRYHRDDAFALAFGADLDAVRARMPSTRLHPVRLGRGRAMVVVIAFDYLETSIGPYGEVGVIVPVVLGRRPPPPLWPLLREGANPDFGALVLHLPVTTERARDAGRGEWGYPKFVADMRFDHTPEALSCELSEGGESILRLEVARGGRFATDARPLRTYSVKHGELVRTTVAQRASCRWQLGCSRSRLELGYHPVARDIASLGLSPTPLLKRYYVERASILPAGEVVERGVKPLDGYRGRDGDGRLVIGHGAR